MWQILQKCGYILKDLYRVIDNGVYSNIPQHINNADEIIDFFLNISGNSNCDKATLVNKFSDS